MIISVALENFKMSEMVERVAIAICNTTGEFEWAYAPEHYKDDYRKEARAAIEAMREPTEAMIRNTPRQDEPENWRAMIDEALK